MPRHFSQCVKLLSSHPVVFINPIIKYNIRITQHLIEEHHILLYTYLYYMFWPIHVAIILLLGRGIPFTNSGYHILILLLFQTGE